ncbi:hypothetical protein [Halolamina salifodinae]|uniref:Uncharacterized protein n=1 Tax=Halolamina salifodinae TaxID=1202767 RepID=A0A8T4H094_9EURY|nr:hypothetical protein [Halolamina salifodinae]MBP1986768.1 hypothetical protein [Halolamina salifodinae]
MSVGNSDSDGGEKQVKQQAKQLAKQQFADEIARLKSKYGGGTVVAKWQNNGQDDGRYGPYAHFVSPPSSDREWEYLGKINGVSNDSQAPTSKDATQQKMDAEEVIAELEIGEEVAELPDKEQENLKKFFEMLSIDPKTGEQNLLPELGGVELKINPLMGGVIDFEDGGTIKTHNFFDGQSVSRKLAENLQSLTITYNKNHNSSSSNITFLHKSANQFGERVGIKSGYSHKDDIKSLDWDDHHPKWDSRHELWFIDADSVQNAKEEFREQGLTVSDKLDEAIDYAEVAEELSNKLEGDFPVEVSE